MTEPSNGWDEFYQMEIGWKITFMLLNLWWNPIGLKYQKIDTCLNFYMLYYLENTDLTEYITCWHAWYKTRIGKGKTLVTQKT